MAIQFSVIVPVYNRPQEVEELLQSLTQQSQPPFEVIIVEDGSVNDCRSQVNHYKKQLPIKYYNKSNSGPGLSRNYGAERATGDYLVFFDSDCLIPPQYFEQVTQHLQTRYTDAYGGPDMAHPDFTPVQKAISYAMTSFFTTGGIRGGNRQVDTYYPRSFNMGYSRQVWETTGGFSDMRFGEDLDMSMRIIYQGFQTQLIHEAAVYHKRRTDFRKFFRQVYNSGIARIHLNLRHPGTLKLVHTFPSLFTLGSLFLLVLTLFWPWAFMPLVAFALLVGVHASQQEKSIKVGLLAIVASFVQLTGYGSGFLKAVWKRYIRKQGEFRAYEKNFYE